MFVRVEARAQSYPSEVSAGMPFRRALELGIISVIFKCLQLWKSACDCPGLVQRVQPLQFQVYCKFERGGFEIAVCRATDLCKLVLLVTPVCANAYSLFF